MPPTPRASAPSVVARLRAAGLQTIGRTEVVRWFHDPRYEQEAVVFVDARNDEHYAEGHIPGAYQVDHYYPAKYLPTVLPVCQTATRVVVYCAGGDCEDSEFAALMLRDAGIPGDRLWVYAGGMTDWATNNLPIELGPRNSGVRHSASP